MRKLTIDYISDLHLSFYIKSKEYGYDEKDIESFLRINIQPKVKGEILIIAGDLSEFVESNIVFLKQCLKYYKKVLYVAGNHEYYLSSILSRKMKEKYINSINKIKYISSTLQNEDNILFLDRSDIKTKGIYNYNGFLIAGDTLWYYPQNIKDWYFYYVVSNDSRLIRNIKLTKKSKIAQLNIDSISWYNNLPNNLDLIITHIPPIYNVKSPKNKNSCYYTTVKTFKAPFWIYGHDHVKASFVKDNTRFLSNPWGYDSKNFPIETLEIIK